ncbi:MAG: ATP-binding cassette domain-containing protein [Alphaproteobacteria bacterium]
MTAQPTRVLSVENLSLTAPSGHVLVENASFTIGPAEIVLLMGPSGSGKSTLINVLSGLLRPGADRWSVSGSLWCGGVTYDLTAEQCNVGGLVFQDKALFNDLTVGENLRIALDHAPLDRTHAEDDHLVAQALALLLDIPPDRRVGGCSGGQQQRVAIARTLLANRPILLFDEPNSGLDRRASQRLARTVKTICQRMGKPAIIVAHHVDDLLPLADHVLMIDPRTRTLRRLPPDPAVVEHEILAACGGSTDADSLPLDVAEDLVAITAGTPWERGIPRGSWWSWFARYFKEYFWVLCASPLMLLYMSLGAMIVGFVSIWFGFNYETIGTFVRSLVHDEALMGIGFIEATVVVPLITSTLLVARNNAIITADIGNRVLSSQLRAMRNLRIPGRAYLVSSIMLNMMLGAVILGLVAWVMSSWTSYKTWQYLFQDQPFELWQENFYRIILRNETVFLKNLGWIVIKVITSVAVASLIAIAVGMGKKDSVVAINHGIARSIVLGVSATLFIHALVAVFQY